MPVVLVVFERVLAVGMLVFAASSQTVEAPTGRNPTAAEVKAGVREVLVTPAPDDAFAGSNVVDDLDQRVVLRVTAIGFEPSAIGHVEQCALTLAGVERCGNRFPVQFGDNGTARFQYLAGSRYLDPDADDPVCDERAHPCVVRLDDGSTTAIVHTVFGASAPRRSVRITPRPSGLSAGDALTLDVRGFAPGDQVDVALCAAPATSGARRCRTLTPSPPPVVAADGTAIARVIVPDDRVGSARLTCDDQVPCGLVVSDGSARPSVAPAIVTFESGPGAAYDAARLAPGILVALALGGVVLWLIRRTDWRKPSEAETPVMDAAELVDV